MDDLRNSQQPQEQPCILYHHPQSICSLMVRYTFALAGDPMPGTSPVALRLQEVDIFNNAQLEEFYLCNVNPKGQVPVLASPGFPEFSITDSLDITLFACERFPSLCPKEHREEIFRLLRELHALNFFSLSFTTRPQQAARFKTGAEERLARSDISRQYRRALEFKLTVINSEKVDGLLPSVVDAEVSRATSYLQELEAIRNASGGATTGSPWIFGGRDPTALDTSVLVFLVRMQGVGRASIIPPSLLQMVQAVGNTEEFKSIYSSL